MRELTPTGHKAGRSARLALILAFLLTFVITPAYAVAGSSLLLQSTTREFIAPGEATARQDHSSLEPDTTPIPDQAYDSSTYKIRLYLPSIEVQDEGVIPAPTQSPTSPIERYVDGIRGSDANPGTAELPWQTIQKAADTMLPGSIAHVLAGTYPERVHVRTSGVPGAPITYQAEGSVTMQGFTVIADYVDVKGFYITGTIQDWKDGVGIFLQGSHSTLDSNYVYFATNGGILLFTEKANPTVTSSNIVRNNRLERNSQYGIHVDGRDNVIEANEIWRTIQHHPGWANPPGWIDADGIRFFGAGHMIRKNYIHDISYADPENVNPHIDCFQTWNDAHEEVGHDIIFEQNICQNLQAQSGDEAGQGFMIEKGATNLIIKNNIIQAFRILQAFDSPRLQIVNNTFPSSLDFTQFSPAGIHLVRSPDAMVENNIFYDVGAGTRPYLNIDSVSIEGSSIGYNNVSRSDGKAPWGSPYPNDLWGDDPRFVAPHDNDFHLLPDSPNIDAGSSLAAVLNDLDGNQRPRGQGYDRGAYEYPTP